MSAESRITSRYAKAVVSLANEQGVLERLKEDAQLLKESCEGSRELFLFLKSPVIKYTKKLSSLEVIFKSQLSDLMLKFIAVVCHKGRGNLLYAISVAILKAYNELKGIQEATVITAVEITSAELANFEKLVMKNTDKSRVALEEKVDKNIIGGFVLNIDDRQIDESVRSKLRNLALQFSK